MKILLLLTTSFPFGTGEEFLCSELPVANGFDHILICPCSPAQGAVQTKELPPSVSLLPLSRKALPKSAYGRLLFFPPVFRELLSIGKHRQLLLPRAHELLYFAKNAEEIYCALQKAFSVQPGDTVTIYSYWFYEAAAAGVRLAHQLRKQGVFVQQISRAHRFDIYQEEKATRYLPMRTYLFSHIDHIFACSKDGAEVLRRQAGPQYAAKITYSYLGTKDCGMGHPSREPFHILTCSNLVPVKRLHLLVAALQQADFPIHWTHIGSGPLEQSVKQAASALPSLVTCEFLGQKSNAEVLQYYQEHAVSVFVNVSESEGIPVSIMEASSFSIPVVATNVGGTHELIQSGVNGFLIPKAFAPETLLQVLRKVAQMDSGDYDALCTNARRIWAEQFHAEKNYRAFYAALSSGASRS